MPNTSTRTHAHTGWLTANLVAQLAFGLLAMTICLPSMQEWPATFGASQAAVQLVFSGYLLGYGGLQLVYGALSDRIGRKPVLLAGLALAVLGSCAGALATQLWMLVAARVLQGAGCAAGMVIGRAMVQDLFAGPERTRVMAFVGMMMGLCPPTAMLLGGQLHVRFGWQANFVVMTVLGVVLWLSAWRWLPAVRPAHDAAHGWRSALAGYATLARDRAFPLYVIILSMGSACFYAFLGGAPLVLGSYGVPPQRVGLFVMFVPLAYIAGNVLTTRLIGRVGDRRLMTCGQACTATGILIVLVLALARVHHPLALAAPLVLLGIGHGLMVPPTLTGTVGLMPALAGSAAAIAGLSQQMIGALGGYLVGLAAHREATALALQMLAWALAGWGAQALLFRRRH